MQQTQTVDFRQIANFDIWGETYALFISKCTFLLWVSIFNIYNIYNYCNTIDLNKRFQFNSIQLKNSIEKCAMQYIRLLQTRTLQDNLELNHLFR